MVQTGERLPRIPDEPLFVREPLARQPTLTPVAKVTPGHAIWPWYLLLAALIGAVVFGAWWLLNTSQQEPPPPQLPLEEVVAPTPAPPQDAVVEQPAAPEPAAPAPTFASSNASANSVGVPELRGRARQRQAGDNTRSVRRAGTERSLFPADEPASAPLPLTGSDPLVVYRPASNRGRVVQLGAFPTRDEAEKAWSRVTRRYPYLKTRSKMVNTVDVGLIGDGRRTRMYRLQLGTSSQAQSVVICQQLDKAGQSCVVVY